MKNQAYERITDRIINLLTHGTVPWHKPWTARTGLPRNFVSQKSYRGINVFLLLAMSYESPLWLTFRQVSRLGGSVRKGEKACPVVFWKQLVIKDKKTEETEKIPMLRFYHVFNIAQCDGLKAIAPAEPNGNGLSTPETIAARMPQPPAIKHGMTHPYYSPREDCVGLPARQRFDTDESYYGTWFHELVHNAATRIMPRRLRITLKTQRFGSFVAA